MYVMGRTYCGNFLGINYYSYSVFQNRTMHPDEFSNWVRIKEALEESGNTENFYYRRACAIVSGGPDPMDNLPNVSQDG